MEMILDEACSIVLNAEGHSDLKRILDPFPGTLVRINSCVTWFSC